MRAEWLDLWALRCRRHGRPLQNFEAVTVEVRYGSAPRARVRNLAEMQYIERGLHRLRPVRLPAIGFPAHLWGLEDIVRGLRSEEMVDCSAWSLAGEWSRARHALLDLVDFLLHGAPVGTGGTLVSWFDHPDDQILPGFIGARPGRNVLGRLSAPWRIRVLSAVAQIVIRPDRYKSLALHGYGKGHFLGLSGLPSRTTKRLKYLASFASEDPLMMLLGVSSAEEANSLARNSQLWPRALRDRLASASWVALTRHA